MSTYELLGLPTEIGVTLFFIFLAIAASPYLGGHEIGILKIPYFSTEKAHIAKRYGWWMPLIPLVLFAQVWSPSTESDIVPAIDWTQTFRSRMKFNSGWIMLGYYKPERKVFVEGPYGRVAYRPIGPERGATLPKINDVLVLTDRRNVRIVGYRKTKLRREMVSPRSRGLREEDLTGLILPKGAFVFVRDITLSQVPGREYIVWCRVADCHENLDQCRRAYLELADN